MKFPLKNRVSYHLTFCSALILDILIPIKQSSMHPFLTKPQVEIIPRFFYFKIDHVLFRICPEPFLCGLFINHIHIQRGRSPWVGIQAGPGLGPGVPDRFLPVCPSII